MLVTSCYFSMTNLISEIWKLKDGFGPMTWFKIRGTFGFQNPEKIIVASFFLQFLCFFFALNWKKAEFSKNPYFSRVIFIRKCLKIQIHAKKRPKNGYFEDEFFSGHVLKQ